MAAVVNFYVFKFQKNKFWAFSQMGIYKKYLKNVRGLKFFRLLGTGGKTGFGLYPDFKTYCFLSVWEDDDYANHFTRKSDFFSKYFKKANTIRVLSLTPFQSIGSTTCRAREVPVWRYRPHQGTAQTQTPDGLHQMRRLKREKLPPQ